MDILAGYKKKKEIKERKEKNAEQKRLASLNQKEISDAISKLEMVKFNPNGTNPAFFNQCCSQKTNIINMLKDISPVAMCDFAEDKIFNNIRLHITYLEEAIKKGDFATTNFCLKYLCKDIELLVEFSASELQNKEASEKKRNQKIFFHTSVIQSSRNAFHFETKASQYAHRLGEQQKKSAAILDEYDGMDKKQIVMDELKSPNLMLETLSPEAKAIYLLKQRYVESRNEEKRLATKRDTAKLNKDNFTTYCRVIEDELMDEYVDFDENIKEVINELPDIAQERAAQTLKTMTELGDLTAKLTSIGESVWTSPEMVDHILAVEDEFDSLIKHDEALYESASAAKMKIEADLNEAMLAN